MLKHSKLWIMWKIVRSLHLFVVIVLIAVVLQAVRVVPIAVPSSNCYALDNSSHIVDFSSWIGRLFEYEGKDSDLVVRFCKDVESRSQSGYIDFGRFDKFNYFVAGSGHVDFVQGFYNGDLVNCEHSFDKLGRTSQVNIICGDCLHRRCKDGLGCICNITYDSSCRVLIDLAIPCEKPGLRVFKGFTVGFHPRSWEIVYNGMTNFGYEKPHQDFRFKTEEAHVSLYMTAIASISSLVKKPIIKVFPEKGLKVSLSGSGASGNPPTTLSPTMLNINWRCEVSGDTPYEVMITIPIEGYEPIQFFLTKTCEYRQIEEGDSTEGWAIFGMISCICLVLSSLLCCGGFIYKTQVEGQRGIDAVPGITLISTCLETVSGGGQSYRRAKDLDCAFAGQCPTSSSQGTWAPSERKYGSI